MIEEPKQQCFGSFVLSNVGQTLLSVHVQQESMSAGQNAASGLEMENLTTRAPALE